MNCSIPRPAKAQDEAWNIGAQLHTSWRSTFLRGAEPAVYVGDLLKASLTKSQFLSDDFIRYEMKLTLAVESRSILKIWSSTALKKFSISCRIIAILVT